MLTEAVILAVLALTKAEIDFLCTPAGQQLAMNVQKRIEVLQARVDVWVARLEAHYGLAAAKAA